MRKFDLKKECINGLIILLPLAPILYFWNQFPDRVPTHFGVDGQPDQWGGKWALFIGVVVNVGIYGLLLVVPSMDPRKEAYEKFGKAYDVIRIAVHLFLSFVSLFIVAYALGYDWNVAKMIPIAICLLFAAIGNQMGRMRQNYTTGIRTPWTLNNEEVWKKTHRISSRVWVIASLLMAVGIAFMNSNTAIFVTFMCYVFGLIVFSFAYSYVWYKRLTTNK